MKQQNNNREHRDDGYGKRMGDHIKEQRIKKRRKDRESI